MDDVKVWVQDWKKGKLTKERQVPAAVVAKLMDDEQFPYIIIKVIDFVLLDITGTIAATVEMTVAATVEMTVAATVEMKEVLTVRRPRPTGGLA